MSHKRTLATAAASYLQVATFAITSLLTLRIAARNLEPQEFGLWGFITQSVGYILLLDLGVSASLGRMFGEPLAEGGLKRFHAWLTLAAILLSLQGVVIVVAGFLLESWVLGWFNIPVHLLQEASILWKTFLLVSGLGLVFRITNALLFAQNRAYLSNLTPIVTSLVSLLVFFLMIEQGHGVLSYAWSTAIGSASGWALGVLFITWGPTKLGLNFGGIEWPMFHRLFGFASAVFLVSIAVQIFFSGQGLIITKLLGLEMAAIFAVTTRIPLLLMQVMWKPFDAFTPRWQVEYCSGNVDVVRKEFRLLTEGSILLGGIAGCFVILALPSFICLWTRPEYFGGSFLVILLAVFLLVQTVLHCASYPFSLAMKMRTYSLVVLCDTLFSLATMVFLIKWIGLPGSILGALLVSMLFSFWYHIKAGFGVFLYNFFRDSWSILLLALAAISLSAAILLVFPEHFIGQSFYIFLFALGIGLLVSSPMIFKICGLIQLFKTALRGGILMRK